MRNAVLVVVLSVLWLGIPRGAQATPILDQQFVPTYGMMHAQLRDGDARAQTFTVGVGGLLSAIGVYLSAPDASAGTLTLGVYPTIGGVPNLSAALAQASVVFPGLSDTPAFYLGNVGAFGLMVNPGEVYAIVIAGLADGPTWRGAYDGDALDVAHYAGGKAYGAPAASTLVPLGGDLGFSTYVDPGDVPPIPEPASLLLLGTGLVGLYARRKRRG